MQCDLLLTGYKCMLFSIKSKEKLYNIIVALLGM